MLFFKPNKKFLLFVTVLTIVFTALFNAPYHFKYYGFSIKFLHNFLAGACLTFATWYILSYSRIVFTILAPILFVIAGALTFFVAKYNLMFNSHVLRVVFEADSREFNAFYEHGALIYALISFVISIIFVVYRNKLKIKLLLKQEFALIAIFCALAFGMHQTLDSEEKGRISMPFIYTESLFNYAVEQIGAAVVNQTKTDLTKIADFEVPEDDIILVLVIGESLTATHMHINGYERQTTPLIEKDGFYSFKYALSSDTMTRESVPKMLSRNTTYEPDTESLKETGIVGLYRKLGFETHWYTNQGRLRHNAPVGIHMGEAEFAKNRSEVKDNRQTGSGLDFNLLPYYKEAVETEAKQKFIVLHTFGSHWNVEDRYPYEFEIFKPVCKSGDECDNENYFNAYDNSILYTDAFLHEVIVQLKDKNALVMYMSDHGSGIAAHETPHARIGARLDNAAIRHVGFVVWASDIYKVKHPEKVRNIVSHLNKLVSGDYLFYSLLDCIDIKSEIILDNMSICNSKMEEYNDKYFTVSDNLLLLK